MYVNDNPDKINSLNLLLAIILTIPFLLCLVVIRELPVKRPSLRAE